VRSADFVFTLLRDSRDVNEYAFALGAMAHYAADNLGHRFAVNKSVPILYPKLRQKFGDVVVYDQNPAAHLKTEFGFDVLEVAKGRYAPDDYRDRIGFQVADDLLKRAFEETYCLKLEAIFTNYSLAIGTYRRAIGSIIPKMTKVAWQEKKDEIMKTDPTMTRARFLYHLSHASYRKRWGREYQEPTIGERILAFFIQILPKVGPLRALSFRMPASDTEQLFMASFNNALTEYERLNRQLLTQGQIQLVNDNFDTGTVTRPGEYPLADQTYADLVNQLAKDHFARVTPELRGDILAFFSDANAGMSIKKNKKEWDRAAREIDDLKSASFVQNGP